MTENPGTTSFGELLRYQRERSVDKRVRMRLSQVQFARKLSQKNGPNRDPQQSRELGNEQDSHLGARPKNLDAILIVLYEYEGIARLDEADRLLEIGGYRTLNDEEARQINQIYQVSCLPSSPTELISNVISASL